MTDPRQRRPAAPQSGERDRILARRRLTLIGLIVAVPVTLLAAIVTGSTLFLLITLVVDIVVAGYVALLLQIKQSQDRRNTAARPRQGVPARR